MQGNAAVLLMPANTKGVPLTDPLTALGVAAQVASDVVKGASASISVIRGLVEKLRAQPDLAAMKLSAAISEVMVTYQAVEGAITRYGGLALDTDALTTRSRDLLTIAGGGLEVEVEDRRGHSREIRYIYDEYLHRWFERVFNAEDLQAMRNAFYGPDGLANADSGLFTRLADVAANLTVCATEAVDLAATGDHDGARNGILTSYLVLAPLQRDLSVSMRNMAQLKNDFVDLTRAG